MVDRLLVSQHAAARDKLKTSTQQMVFDLISGTNRNALSTVAQKGRKKKTVKKKWFGGGFGGSTESVRLGYIAANLASGAMPAGRAQSTAFSSVSGKGAGDPNRRAGKGKQTFDAELGTYTRRGPFGPEAFSVQMNRWMPLKAAGRLQPVSLKRDEDDHLMDTRAQEGEDPKIAALARQDRFRNRVTARRYGVAADEIDKILSGEGVEDERLAGPENAVELGNAGVEMMREARPQMIQTKEGSVVHAWLTDEFKRRGISDKLTHAIARNMLRETDTNAAGFKLSSIVDAAVEDATKQKFDDVEREAGYKERVASLKNEISSVGIEKERVKMQNLFDKAKKDPALLDEFEKRYGESIKRNQRVEEDDDENEEMDQAVPYEEIPTAEGPMEEDEEDEPDIDEDQLGGTTAEDDEPRVQAQEAPFDEDQGTTEEDIRKGVDKKPLVPYDPPSPSVPTVETPPSPLAIEAPPSESPRVIEAAPADVIEEPASHEPVAVNQAIASEMDRPQPDTTNMERMANRQLDFKSKGRALEARQEKRERAARDRSDRRQQKMEENRAPKKERSAEMRELDAKVDARRKVYREGETPTKREKKEEEAAPQPDTTADEPAD